MASLDFRLKRFYLQIVSIFPTKVRVKWPFDLGGELQHSFFKMAATVAILGFSIGTIVDTFDLQIAPILPTKFRGNWPFGSEEAQNRFSRWRPWRPSLSFDRNWFQQVLIYKLPRYSLPSTESMCLAVKEKKRKIYFQDSGRGGHLKSFDLNDFRCFWSTIHLNTSYQVSSQLVQECRRSSLWTKLLPE